MAPRFASDTQHESRYEGTDVDSIGRHGEMMIKEDKRSRFQDGRQYKGQWVDSAAHGHGEMTWSDGRRPGERASES